jgi:hypothetical protein
MVTSGRYPEAARFHQSNSRCLSQLAPVLPKIAIHNTASTTFLHAKTLRTSPLSGQEASKFFLNQQLLPATQGQRQAHPIQPEPPELDAPLLVATRKFLYRL